MWKVIMSVQFSYNILQIYINLIFLMIFLPPSIKAECGVNCKSLWYKLKPSCCNIEHTFICRGGSVEGLQKFCLLDNFWGLVPLFIFVNHVFPPLNLWGSGTPVKKIPELPLNENISRILPYTWIWSHHSHPTSIPSPYRISGRVQISAGTLCQLIKIQRYTYALLTMLSFSSVHFCSQRFLHYFMHASPIQLS